MLTTKRNMRRLRVLTCALHLFPIFLQRVQLEHFGAHRCSRRIADDGVQAIVPDGVAVAQIVIESAELGAFEREPLPLLAFLQRNLGCARCRGIPEDDDHTPDFTIVAADRRAAVLDREFSAVAADQHRLARRAGQRCVPQNLCHRTFGGLAVSRPRCARLRLRPGLARPPATNLSAQRPLD